MSRHEYLKAENDKNKIIETNILQLVLVVANAWVTLFAPILIGFFITKLFSTEIFTKTELAVALISAFLHIVFTLVIYKISMRRSLSLEVEKIFSENEHFKVSVIPKALDLYENAKIQQTVSYLMTLDLENIIDEINSQPQNGSQIAKINYLEEGLNRILGRLVKYRHELFGYKGGDLYNICLYIFDSKSQSLVIKWRSHDDRLKTSNRSWAPGIGHVGLTFILNEIKICHDIYESTELSSSASSPEDKEKYRSFLSVPIKDSANIFNGGKPLGVLVFTSSACGQFSLDRDKMFALTVAKLLSMHIEKWVKSM